MRAVLYLLLPSRPYQKLQASYGAPSICPELVVVEGHTRHERNKPLGDLLGPNDVPGIVVDPTMTEEDVLTSFRYVKAELQRIGRWPAIADYPAVSRCFELWYLRHLGVRLTRSEVLAEFMSLQSTLSNVLRKIAADPTAYQMRSWSEMLDILGGKLTDRYLRDEVARFKDLVDDTFRDTELVRLIAQVEETNPEPPRGRPSPAQQQLNAVLKNLGRAAVRVPAATWPANVANIDRPGIYAVWVNQEGAEDLSKGIDLSLESGRIYVGQTGSQGKSPAFLRERILGRHLKGSVRTSTLRHTLAAILQRSPGRSRSDEGILPPGESELSKWMRSHLEIAVSPIENPKILATLEQQVIEMLDPPLNLRGMRRTPLRDRISGLRKVFGQRPVSRKEGQD